MTQFRFPGGDKRTTILGATGSGKSTCGLWMLAHQRLDVRPWIIFDFKREPFFDKVGFPPIHHMGLADPPPRKPGLYLVTPRPGQDDAVEAFLWRVFEAENIGLFVDEASLMPSYGDAFPACIQQGRSKHIPIIACCQRPVGVPRGLFSQADFICVYRIRDAREYKVIEAFVPPGMTAPLGEYHWRYWDDERRVMLNMRPVPGPAIVATQLQANAPYRLTGWHPFVWSGRKSNRDASRLN